ncbi:putative manganese-dependent inorganic diphosphatase [Catenibacterium mitsuokai]|uniref:putative manganese-dependent inorganic diphosphatase n=1 Tax=Catenibacterium mitsuokai TaxID=100886 RepID=UPI0018AC5AAB|nr:putative manganese-dependent inorganic diphosphatase [Catenibacterium mitsuokai]
MDLVYVSGHKNPDTDSICAAISYSYLLNATHKYGQAIPVRLGEVSRETEYVLKRFNAHTPQLLKSVKQKVEDLDYDQVTLFSKELTLRTAWSLMCQMNLKSAPVLDDHSHLLGLLSSTNIIEGYMEDWDKDILKNAHTPIENVVDTLDAKIVYLNPELRTIKGSLHITGMNSQEVIDHVNEHDVIITGGDRTEGIREMLKKKVDLIILTNSLHLEESVLEECKNAGVSVVATAFTTFKTSQQIIQAVPVEYVMQKGDLTCFSTDDTVDYLKEVMSETRYHSYPVIDLNDQVVGTISRFQVITGDHKKMILVDHNERGQAVEGIEEAEILEVVDHHRVADFQTVGPLQFRAEPLGCTCTIIAKMYKEQGVEIPKNVAGLMLAAIISDTLLFRSPTCTKTDKEIALELAEIAGVDAEEFGLAMFKAGTSLVGKSIEEIYNQDYKAFNIGDAKVGIAQVNTMDIDGFAPLKAEMLEYMENLCVENGFDTAVLLLTDVINATSEVFVAGSHPEYVENAFNVQLVEHQANLPGVISRKKQVVPAITRAINA